VLDISKSDGKIYTLVLEDEILPLRADGREQSTVSWEADVNPKAEGETVLVKWGDFEATYPGMEKDDVGELKKGELKKGELKKVSVMCRR
jgi:hypothetical protein